jgi:hypothetical protein
LATRTGLSPVALREPGTSDHSTDPVTARRGHNTS